MPVSKKRKTKKNGAGNRRLTIRQSARKAAEDTMANIIQAYDNVNVVATQVFEPVEAEMGIAESFFKDKLNSPVIDLADEDRFNKYIDRLEEIRDDLEIVKQNRLNALVFIDKEMHKADATATKVMELVQGKKEISEDKDTLLGYEVELAMYMDNVLDVVHKVTTDVSNIVLVYKNYNEHIPEFNETVES